MEIFKFADMNIAWNLKKNILATDERMELFRSNDIDDKDVDIQFVEKSMDLKEFEASECLRRTGAYELLKTEKGLFLLNHWGKLRYGYGIWMNDLYRSTVIPIYVNEEMKKQIPINMTRFMGTLGLHSVLLMRNTPIIHASYVAYKRHAILFSAPSGGGKSTQAQWWERCTDSKIINGDRVLVREHSQAWYAYGYPCCGSSDICLNESLPIAAIVILQKGSCNVIEELSIGQKVSMLVSAMELYLWEGREINQAFKIAEAIISSVPVFKLVCRPEAEAVEILKNYLEEKGYV